MYKESFPSLYLGQNIELEQQRFSKQEKQSPIDTEGTIKFQSGFQRNQNNSHPRQYNYSNFHYSHCLELVLAHFEEGSPRTDVGNLATQPHINNKTNIRTYRLYGCNLSPFLQHFCNAHIDESAGYFEKSLVNFSHKVLHAERINIFNNIPQDICYIQEGLLKLFPKFHPYRPHLGITSNLDSLIQSRKYGSQNTSTLIDRSMICKTHHQYRWVPSSLHMDTRLIKILIFCSQHSGEGKNHKKHGYTQQFSSYQLHHNHMNRFSRETYFLFPDTFQVLLWISWNSSWAYFFSHLLNLRQFPLWNSAFFGSSPTLQMNQLLSCSLAPKLFVQSMLYLLLLSCCLTCDQLGLCFLHAR